MSTYSEYKGLELPTSPEHYDIAVVNKNNMVIDSELHKLDLKNESQDQLLATKEALNSEISRASEKENEILEKLNDEIIRAAASDNEIMDLLENEINRATAAEKTNANNLAAHIADEDNPHKVTPDIIGAVNKSGDTMTGNLTIEKNTANQSAYFTAKRTDTNTTVGFGVGSGGVNHGVYSTTLGKWIVYADDSKVYLNGNAETATKAEYLNVHSIAANTNLNNVTTAGFYKSVSIAIAQTLQNCPTTNAFFMIVGEHAGKYQEIIEYVTVNPKRYMRNYYNGTWSSWYKVYTGADKPTPSDIGAVNKTGDTMSGYLYSTAGTSTDGRKTRLYNNGIRFMFPNTAAGGLYFGSLDENTYFSTMGYYHNSLAPENNYFYCGSTYDQYSEQLRLKEVWAGTQNAHKGVSRVNGTDFFRSYTYKPANNGYRALYLMFDVTDICTADSSATGLLGTLFEGTVFTKRSNGIVPTNFGNIANRDPVQIKMGASYKKSLVVNNTTLVLKTSNTNIKPILVKDNNENKYYLGFIVVEYDGCLLAFNGVLHGNLVDKWVSMPNGNMPSNIEVINDNAEILTYPVANKAINDNEGNPILSSYMRLAAKAVGYSIDSFSFNVNKNTKYIVYAFGFTKKSSDNGHKKPYGDTTNNLILALISTADDENYFKNYGVNVNFIKSSNCISLTLSDTNPDTINIRLTNTQYIQTFDAYVYEMN